MSNLRLALTAVALFAGTFVGVSWASKGFPAITARAVPVKPAPVPGLEHSAKPGLRRDREDSRISQGDGDAGRNQMRLTTIQAAEAYALSPCDRTVKAAFVVAASTYMRGTVKSGTDARNPVTPMDKRVREAIEAAIGAGGIGTQDFPRGSPLWAMASMHHGEPPPCAGGRRAERPAR